MGPAKPRQAHLAPVPPTAAATPPPPPLLTRQLLKHAALAMLGLLLLVYVAMLAMDRYVRTSTAAAVVPNAQQAPVADVALLLPHPTGSTCQAYNQAIASQAAQLWAQRRVMHVVIGRQPNHPTGTCPASLQDALRAQGVPHGAIHYEYAAEETYQTMYRLREAYGFDRVVVLGPSAKVPGALVVARSLNLEAHGLEVGPSPGQEPPSLVARLAQRTWANAGAVMDGYVWRPTGGLYVGKPIRLQRVDEGTF